jgi:nicotinamidase-related amidase
MPYPTDDPYLNWRTPLPPLELSPNDTALLVIDMQYSDAAIDDGVFARKRAQGLTAGLDYFEGEMDKIVPVIRRMQDVFREHGYEVMFSRIKAMTKDGRDRGKVHKNLNIHAQPGSKESEVLEEIAPLDDEIVFSKTTGSVFNSTPIHQVLSSMGIRNLIMCGVMSSGCVESAARDAIDLGYGVVVVADASASWTEELHRSSMRVMNGVFSRVQTSEQVLCAVQNKTPLAMNTSEVW